MQLTRSKCRTLARCKDQVQSHYNWKRLLDDGGLHLTGQIFEIGYFVHRQDEYFGQLEKNGENLGRILGIELCVNFQSAIHLTIDPSVDDSPRGNEAFVESLFGSVVALLGEFPGEGQNRLEEIQRPLFRLFDQDLLEGCFGFAGSSLDELRKCSSILAG